MQPYGLGFSLAWLGSFTLGLKYDIVTLCPVNVNNLWRHYTSGSMTSEGVRQIHGNRRTRMVQVSQNPQQSQHEQTSVNSLCGLLNCYTCYKYLIIGYYWDIIILNECALVGHYMSAQIDHFIVWSSVLDTTEWF